MKNSAIYIHIPFCDHKCIYCDFYSIITTDNIKPFLKSLKKEIEYYSSKFKEERKFFSIFFGGGTPSLMEPGYIEEIIIHLKDHFYIDDNCEVTLETNPGTVNKEKIKKFREAGINRMSIGIQSFNEDELKFLTRIHNKQAAIQTVYDTKESGIDNISIDLIFNLPGQTKEKWKTNLETAVNLPVKHVSAYSLILERGTILNKMVIDGEVEMQDDDYDADLYETTIDFLAEHGFIQYEVSNFAKYGFECKHNNAYWNYQDYLGLGTAAHSFFDNKRWWNYSSLKRYISEIEKNKNAVAGEENLTDEQIFNEYIMLSLRSRGINLKELKKKFGEVWINKNYGYFNNLKSNNYVIFDNDYIRLTRKGYPVCDEILSNIL